MQRQVLSSAGSGATSSIITMHVNDVRLLIDGIFDGQTVTLQSQSPEGGWLDIANGSFSAPDTKILRMNKGAQLRLAVSVGGSPSINAWIIDR